jgi:hypothetical protein
MGEHAFSHTGIASQLSWLGVALGVLLALLLYYLTTKSGMSLVGVEEAKSVERWDMTMTVLWVILMAVSLVPMVLVEVSLGAGQRVSFKKAGPDIDPTVDLLRVRELASSGLSIALAASFLMVTCNIADERNIRRDVSYFKTSSPGSATVNMINTLSEPLRVLVFFPEGNQVAVEVEEYLKALESKTPLEYEVRDRLIDSGLAKEHQVSKEGTLVLLRGDASEKLTISTDYNVARKKALREFDAEFQKSLMAVIRDTKTAYFMVGHGELNDPESGGAITGTSPLLKSTLIKAALAQLNYKTKDYEGFGKPIPDDCSVLLVLAPRVALMDDELIAIDDYLARGGSAIFAFDPEAEMRLGMLEKRLGVTFNATPIADDKEFMVRTRTISDHSLILTNQFLSHASISTMGRGNARAAILFVKPGSFDETETAAEFPNTKKSQIIRTMQTAFRDQPDAAGKSNFTFDSETEKRDRYTIGMAIENPDAIPQNLPEGVTHNGMRVVLLADREVLSDGILARVAVVQNMLIDIIKWTGGEEAYSGKTTSEKDKRIEHTKSQDAVWFYGTMLAAPIFVLCLGLLYIGTRRRRKGSKS